MQTKYKEVLLLDADNVPVVNPEFLFDSPEFTEHGALFWPDMSSLNQQNTLWKLLKLNPVNEIEFETGQILVNKSKAWFGLCLSMWINEHSDFFYHFFHGDKEAFHFGFLKTSTPYYVMPYPTVVKNGVMNQYDFNGKLLFQHRNGNKWQLEGNPQIPNFQFEKECISFLEELAAKWRRKPVEMKQNNKIVSPLLRNFGMFGRRN
jgi:hypothetical protein